jgi:hypothetical protein
VKMLLARSGALVAIRLESDTLGVAEVRATKSILLQQAATACRWDPDVSGWGPTPVTFETPVSLIRDSTWRQRRTTDSASSSGRSRLAAGRALSRLCRLWHLFDVRRCVVAAGEAGANPGLALVRRAYALERAR